MERRGVSRSVNEIEPTQAEVDAMLAANRRPPCTLADLEVWARHLAALDGKYGNREGLQPSPLMDDEPNSLWRGHTFAGSFPAAEHQMPRKQVIRNGPSLGEIEGDWKSTWA